MPFNNTSSDHACMKFRTQIMVAFVTTINPSSCMKATNVQLKGPVEKGRK